MMSQSSIVGFSVAKASGQHYGNGDAITFTNVLYNEGGHFIPATNRYKLQTSILYKIWESAHVLNVGNDVHSNSKSNYYDLCTDTVFW